MELKEHTYKIKGMNMDLSNSIFSPEFSWRNRNIRLTVRGANDTLLVSNERGNISLTVNEYFRNPSDVKYSYVSSMISYLNTKALPTFTYTPTVIGHVNTMANPSYTYTAIFDGYKNTIEDPSYTYTSVILNYVNTLIEQ